MGANYPVVDALKNKIFMYKMGSTEALQSMHEKMR